MKILLNRIYFQADSTVGCLKVESENGWNYLCDTLEPRAIAWVDIPLIGQKAEEKVAGKTAIPEGVYRIVLKENLRHKRVLPTLVGVPQFKHVTLRTGKIAGQSLGDILVGSLRKIPHPSEDPYLEHSRKVLKQLYKMIEAALQRGEPVWIIVRSRKIWKETHPLAPSR